MKVLISTPDERPPNLKGHIYGEKGWPYKRGSNALDIYIQDTISILDINYKYFSKLSCCHHSLDTISIDLPCFNNYLNTK